MAQKSILYQGPFTYKFGLWLIHGKNLARRYTLIANECMDTFSALEPACGPAMLAGYLPNQVHYSGFDLNRKFVDYCATKGLDVYEGDIFNPDSYKHAEVVALCDILHHLNPDNQKLTVTNSAKAACSKVVVCEPFKDKLLAAFPAWSHWLVERWYDYADCDGYTTPTLKQAFWKKDLEELMMQGFGVLQKPSSIKEIGEDLIAVYQL